MINVDSPSGFSSVFEAPAPGLYAFAFQPDSTPLAQDPQYAVNEDSDAGLFTSGLSKSRFVIVYLAQDDELLFKGPSGSLAGVRIGDELFEE